MYKFISLIVFFLLIIGSVNAITEDEKVLIQEGIEKYSGDLINSELSFRF